MTDTPTKRASLTVEIKDGETVDEALRSLLGFDPNPIAETTCSCEETAPAKSEPREEKPLDDAAQEPEKAEEEKVAPKPKKAKKEAAAEADKDKVSEVRRAAMDKINAGKRDEVEKILEPFGGLKGVPAESLDEVLSSIEAL